MTPTNPQPEMEISEIARLAASDNYGAVHSAYGVIAIDRHTRRIEQAINQSTAPLRGEIERKEKEVLSLMAEATRMANVVKSKEEEIERLKETNSGIPHVYKRLMKMSPWTESNDMNWEDEMDCGFNGLQERLVEQENQITQLEKQVLILIEAMEMALKAAHPTAKEQPAMFAAWCKMNEALSYPVSDVAFNYTKREVLEKLLEYNIEHGCVCAKAINPTKACDCGRDNIVTLANEELKKGQS